MSIEEKLYQKLRYAIHVYEEETLLTVCSDGKVVERRFVEPEQLHSLFKTSIVFRPEEGLVLMKTDGMSDEYYYTYPARKVTILYRKHVGKKKAVFKHRICLPNLLVRATVSRSEKGRFVTGINLWGYEDKTLVSGTKLYEIPLPNISGSGMCLGAVDKKVEGSLKDMIWSLITDIPFNNHNSSVTRDEIPYEEYYKSTRGRFRIEDMNCLGTAGQKVPL